MTHHRTDYGMDPRAMATGLGWFSIALGAAELLSPGSVTRFLGLRGTEPVVRTFGVREVATGIGLLTARDPAPWLWARVAGDALDILTASTALERHNPQRGNAGLALASLIGITVLDVMAARAAQADRHERTSRVYDYSDRSGLPRSPDAVRGTERATGETEDERWPRAAVGGASHGAGLEDGSEPAASDRGRV
ncbi:hypothetical protein [Mongoliimonas terrestris]|uniref:hypothetical protein n=1 Tax=Mongoliimonas terrestris TaxID=1709001 RepID=UPI000A5CD909|nr:hypothetical protein [Mongoliimonas terrestris]